MGIRTIAFNLGLTKERRTELSDDVLYELGKVNFKRHDTIDFEAMLGYFALGTYGPDEFYEIGFGGQKTSFRFNNKRLFNAFNMGDKVTIAYREVYTATYDYIPPEFRKKRLVDRVLSDTRFVDVKLNSCPNTT